MLDRFAVPHLVDHALFFLPSVRRNDQADMLTDGLRGTMAEETFGGGIPGCNDAFGRRAHDCIVRGRDDRRQERDSLLAFLSLDDLGHQHLIRASDLNRALAYAPLEL